MYTIDLVEAKIGPINSYTYDSNLAPNVGDFIKLDVDGNKVFIIRYRMLSINPKHITCFGDIVPFTEFYNIVYKKDTLTKP